MAGTGYRFNHYDERCSVLDSYSNLTIAVGALALLLIAVTLGRLGYREEDPELAATPTYG